MGDRGEEGVDLAIDDDRIQTLFATEVLVDHRLRHASRSGDLLDRRALEALLGEHEGRGAK